MENEKTFVFKEEDLMKYGVVSPDGNEFMAMISGFDLNLAFNMRLINSLGDAESCANAMADVFYEALMEELIAQKPGLIQPTENNPAIPNK